MLPDESLNIKNNSLTIKYENDIDCGNLRMYRLSNPCPETTKANNVCSDLEPSVNCKSLERRETRHKSWTKRNVITERQIDKILWSIAQPPREHYVGGEQSSDSRLSFPPQLFHTAGQVQTSTADEFLASNCFGWSWTWNQIQMKSVSSTLLNETLKIQHLVVFYQQDLSFDSIQVYKESFYSNKYN